MTRSPPRPCSAGHPVRLLDTDNPVVLANIFQPLIDFFEWILLLFHDDLGLGWGASIIAMTVVVRAALLPLTFKQFKSMQALAKHAPEMKKLQDRYKNDRERLNQEMMKFYRENKVNPFASCLPLLAQLPVFLSLFYMLQDDLRLDICPEVNPPGTTDPRPCGEGGDAGFLFIPDLTDKATGGVLIALIVLYVASQLFSTLLMSTTTDRTQRMIFLALPFFFVIFIVNFPAGLLVYWITTNLWTIVQQAIIRKRLGPIRPPGAEPGMGLGELLRGGGGGGPPAPATASSGGGGGGAGNPPKGRPSGPPPAPPRRKKKRSGRRR
jgi:YidC/Oxa1 family membrane protein insertase